MASTKLMQEVENVLKKFDGKYFVGDKVNKARVIEDIDNYNVDLMSAMLDNKRIKNNFTTKIEEHTVFKTNQFIEVFQADEYWEDSYTKYSKKIGLASNGNFLDEASETVLDFPYKDTVLKASMSKEDTDKEDLKPDEPFLNEVIAQEEIDVLLDKKILKNAKKYTKEGEEETSNFSDEDNLILKGNNLLALHTLKDKYAGKVKLIYIDPPYNTGNDSFKYNDNFNHASWLTFMKNRLEIAKILLSDDGIIVIQCDNNEQAYLNVIADEIFGKENFEGKISVKMSTLSGVKTSHKDKAILKEAEYLLVYAKNEDKFKVKPQYKPTRKISDEFKYYLDRNNSDDPKNWEVKNLREVLEEKKLEYNFDNDDTFKFIENHSNNIWRRAFIRNKFKKISQEKPNEVIRNIDNNGIEHLYYRGRELFFLNQKYHETFTEENGYKVENSMLLGDMWDDINISRLFNEGGVSFNNGKKPEFLIARLLDMFTTSNDIVLDFFMGTGTTQAVSHKMNRKYIGIEQMDYIQKLTIERLSNVIDGEPTGVSNAVDWQGGGSFVYAELMEKNRGYLTDVMDAPDQESLRNVFNLMLEYADFDFRVDLEEVEDSLHTLSLEDQKRILVKILDKNQLYYNYSEIDDKNVRDLISDNDYQFNQSFYKEANDE